MVYSVFDYFKAEKKHSVYCIVLGLISVMLTIIFLAQSEPFYNGVAYSLVAVGVIQLVIGVNIYLRSDLDSVGVDHFMHKDFNFIKDQEIPRMELQIKNLIVYSYVEIGCIALGLLLWLYCNPLTLSKGVGIGLVIQSSVMLVIDFLAEQRGKIYLNFLKSLLKQAS